MASIMQGTTPSLVISIDPNDLLVADVARIELYVRNKYVTTTYTEDDLAIDTGANTITKQFTESETSSYRKMTNVIVQARLWLNNGNIVGTDQMIFDVADMLEVGRDG